MSLPVEAAFAFSRRGQPMPKTQSHLPCSNRPLRTYYHSTEALVVFIKSARRRFMCCTLKADDESESSVTHRRSGNFKPNMWDYNLVQSQSLTGEYTKKKYMEEVERMKDDVRVLINAQVKDHDPLALLELIDAVQRLGLQYHFDREIKHALGSTIHSSSMVINKDDLYATALRFRLLRQHGYDVPQDVFEKFMDDGNGKFYASLTKDVKGVLSLYEASFHGFIDESIIDEAMAFSTACLKKINDNVEEMPPSLIRKVDHALDMPIRCRPSRLEARWFMEYYEYINQEPTKMNTTLLRLAKLDYNILQTIHKREAAELARWWLELGIANMTFFRDRVMEGYLWQNLMVFEPQYEAFRVLATRLCILITVIDDIYDVYASLDELKLLTKLIDRWDTSGVEKLPPTIRTCFLTLYKTTNELGDWVMKERGINVISYLHKVWADQCNAYLVEAKWFHKRLKPSFKEYIDNATISIGVCIMLMNCFVTTSDNLPEEKLEYVAKFPSIVRCSAKIVRLNNDLATSTEEIARGDTLKAVECYMNETGVTEEVGREHMKNLVIKTWKVMNKDELVERRRFSEPFIDACLNLARASQSFYQYGDGHGIPDAETKENLLKVLVQAVPIMDSESVEYI